MTPTQRLLRYHDIASRAAAVLRAGEGNPNHKPSGPGGGQFASGGGSGHGKHWAKRQRRQKRLEQLKKGFRSEAKDLKTRHKAEHRELTRDHKKAMADKRKEHTKDRKDHLKWEASERKGLAKEHAREHAANDRQHAKALAKHEKDAPKRHAAVDKAHSEKAQRIARGERAAKRIEERHAAEREAHAKSLEGLESANERFYAGLRKGKANAPDHEKAALEKQIADHREKVKAQPERQRAEMAARHAYEKEKASNFLAKSGSLKDRLVKQTAAKHREVDRTPDRLAKQHAGAKERLEAEHAEAREAQRNEHREARKDLRKDQREDRESLRADHKEEREGLKDTHREERKEFIEGVRQDLADHGFKRKGTKSGDAESVAHARGTPSDRRLSGSAGSFQSPGVQDVVSLGFGRVSDGLPGRARRNPDDRRFHHGRTQKASSAEDILRYLLRQRSWSGPWRRGELTGKQLLELLSDVGDYGMAWLHHEAEQLFRVHGRKDERLATALDGTRTSVLQANLAAELDAADMGVGNSRVLAPGEPVGSPSSIAGRSSGDFSAAQSEGLTDAMQAQAASITDPGGSGPGMSGGDRGVPRMLHGDRLGDAEGLRTGDAGPAGDPHPAQAEGLTDADRSNGVAAEGADLSRRSAGTRGSPPGDDDGRERAVPRPVPWGADVGCLESGREGHDLDQAISRALSGAIRSHVGRFFARAKHFVRELIVAGAMALAGPGGLSDEELADADHAAQVQAEFLGRFEREVLENPPIELQPAVAGPPSPLQSGVFVLPTVEPSGAALREPMTAREFAARAESYGKSGNTAPHEINRRAVIRSGQATAERRIHGYPIDDMCSICREAVARGWSPLGSLPPIGDSECLTSCHCHFEFRRADGSIFILAREARRAA